MSRSAWLSQFTPSEYQELRLLASLEPIGIDRINYYLSVLCSAATGGKMKVADFMFEQQARDPAETNEQVLARWMSKNSAIIRKAE